MSLPQQECRPESGITSPDSENATASASHGAKKRRSWIRTGVLVKGSFPRSQGHTVMVDRMSLYQAIAAYRRQLVSAQDAATALRISHRLDRLILLAYRLDPDLHVG